LLFNELPLGVLHRLDSFMGSLKSVPNIIGLLKTHLCPMRIGARKMLEHCDGFVEVAHIPDLHLHPGTQ
jgi:hypothetical protein